LARLECSQGMGIAYRSRRRIESCGPWCKMFHALSAVGKRHKMIVEQHRTLGRTSSGRSRDEVGMERFGGGVYELGVGGLGEVEERQSML
jgi:hypothetical protein